MSDMLLVINDLAVTDSGIKLPETPSPCAGESPQPPARTCRFCSGPITDSDLRAKHCSDACALASKREHRNARQAAYRERFPERERAKLTLGNAIRGGHVRRVSRCEECGERAFTEGHHTDYSRPFYVTWLCRSCHAALEDGRHFGAGQTKPLEHGRSVPHRSVCAEGERN
jgi:hypothetical protein